MAVSWPKIELEYPACFNISSFNREWGISKFTARNGPMPKMNVAGCFYLCCMISHILAKNELEGYHYIDLFFCYQRRWRGMFCSVKNFFCQGICQYSNLAMPIVDFLSSWPHSGHNHYQHDHSVQNKTKKVISQCTKKFIYFVIFHLNFLTYHVYLIMMSPHLCCKIGNLSLSISIKTYSMYQ